jgi:fructose/tagatose bisphosphate aldolase
MKKQQLQVVLQAKHIHTLAEYGATVILHTDHCKKLLPWIDGLLDASEEHFAATAVIQLSYD